MLLFRVVFPTQHNFFLLNYKRYIIAKLIGFLLLPPHVNSSFFFSFFYVFHIKMVCISNNNNVCGNRNQLYNIIFLSLFFPIKNIKKINKLDVIFSQTFMHN